MTDTSNTIGMTADIVAAFVSNNNLSPAELPNVIQNVYGAIAAAATGETAQQPAERPQPAVSIKKSITPDHLISLEDGKKYKSLKRHLSTRGMTPDQYRAKWDLPNNYPMVAASYAAQRSELAKKIGLGSLRRGTAAAGRDAKAPAAKTSNGGRKKKASEPAQG